MKTPIFFTLFAITFFGLSIGLLLYSVFAGAPYYFETAITFGIALALFGIGVMVTAFSDVLKSMANLINVMQTRSMAPTDMRPPMSMTFNKEQLKNKLDSLPDDHPLKDILQEAYDNMLRHEKTLPLSEISLEVLQQMYEEALEKEDYVEAGKISKEIEKRKS